MQSHKALSITIDCLKTSGDINELFKDLIGYNFNIGECVAAAPITTVSCASVLK